jgi:hypothetical protein
MMKSTCPSLRRSLERAIALIGIVAATTQASAAVVVLEFNDVNKAVPDGLLSGQNDTRTVSIPYTRITDVNVRLELVGTGPAFNGDYYVTLVHESGARAVLLNRPGRKGTFDLGYPDNGFAITLDDQAERDIHLYRDHVVPELEAPITGTWQPDARTALPGEVTHLSERDGWLSVFNGLDPNGAWTLFFADVEAGGTGTLKSWALEITAVPEPIHALPAALGLGALAMVRRAARRGKHLG